MNNKTGWKETSAAVIIFSVSPMILILASVLSRKLNTGAWINFALDFFILIPAVIAVVFFLKKYATDIIQKTHEKTIYTVIGLIYIVMLFIYTGFGFYLSAEAIGELGYFSFDREQISLFPVIAATIGAYMGIESNTRTSYILFFVSLTIMTICVILTFKAWDFDNLMPLMGNDMKTTLFGTDSLTAYSGLMITPAVTRYLKKSTHVVKCTVVSFLVTAVINFTFIVIYIVSIPYPLTALYEMTPKGLFSLMASGELFHRFEIFVISLHIILNVAASSFGIAVCSDLIASISRTGDARPFVPVLGALLYAFNFFDISPDICIVYFKFMTVIFFVSVLIYISIKAICRKWRWKK